MSRGGNLSKLFCLSSGKGFTLKEKNLLPSFGHFGVDTNLEGLAVQESKQEVIEVIYLVKNRGKIY